MGKLPNYVQYFGPNIVEGVAESWVETDMSWVEVDGAGWSWVHGLVTSKLKFCNPVLKEFQQINVNVRLRVDFKTLR